MSNLTRLIQSHKAHGRFNYDQIVDWAIELLSNGTETEHVLILASFTKPTHASDVQPYLSAALKELDIEEKDEHFAFLDYVHMKLEPILRGMDHRPILKELHALCIERDHDPIIFNFYLYHYALEDLEVGNFSFYVPEVNKGNYEIKLKEEVTNWIATYIQ